MAEQGATSTSYIFAGADLVATREGSGAATTTRYIHADHLASTNVASDAAGAVAQVIDYHPYGAERISENYDGSETRRTYIGELSDPLGLSYLNARYMDPARGQFTSQDPVFWEVGQTQDGQTILGNPQLQNAYGYAANNPIALKDPTGRWLEIAGNLVAGSRSFSLGVRWDRNGVDGFISGGWGVGVSAGINVAWAPQIDLPHREEAVISTSFEAADLIGGRVSYDVLSYSSGKGTMKPGMPTGAFVLGFGSSVSVQEELTSPLYIWGSLPTPRFELPAADLQSVEPRMSVDPRLSSGSASTNNSAHAGITQTLSALQNTLTQLSSALSSYNNK